ncbi:unnamed protein product [Citrullus colocynthis]|uniref:Uncharacterized protein n=1 Tax=Citrullus colocynthis TaxID=252529 RepID=A0ABP0XYH2_9ROSI
MAVSQLTRGTWLDSGSSSSFFIQFPLPSHFTAGFHSPTLSEFSDLDSNFCLAVKHLCFLDLFTQWCQTEFCNSSDKSSVSVCLNISTDVVDSNFLIYTLHVRTRINQSTERAGRKDTMSEPLRYLLKSAVQMRKSMWLIRRLKDRQSGKNR